MIRAAENYTVRVRGDFWIRAKRPVKGGLKNLVETMPLFSPFHLTKNLFFGFCAKSAIDFDLSGDDSNV